MVTGILSHKLKKRNHCGYFIPSYDDIYTDSMSCNLRLPPMTLYPVKQLYGPINV